MEKPQMVSLTRVEKEFKRFGLADREWPLEQKFAEVGQFGFDLRLAGEPTRSTKIALEEHRRFHVLLGDFGAIANLNVHMAFMLKGMLNGLSFMQAHAFALNVGPKPHMN